MTSEISEGDPRRHRGSTNEAAQRPVPGDPNRWPLVVAMTTAAVLLGVAVWVATADDKIETATAAAGDPSAETATTSTADPDNAQAEDPSPTDSDDTTSSTGTKDDSAVDDSTVTTASADSTTTPETSEQTTTTASPDGSTDDTNTDGTATTDVATTGVETTTTVGGVQDPPVTTTPIPSSDVESWDFSHDFGAVQQWMDGNEDCIRLYSPITRDPESPSVTNIHQLTVESCIRSGVTTVDDWYVDVIKEHQLAVLRYALPPVFPTEVWVTNSTGYQTFGFVDGQFWGFDLYWTADVRTLHFREADGEVVSVDLPTKEIGDDVVRLYIGRPIALG